MRTANLKHGKYARRLTRAEVYGAVLSGKVRTPEEDEQIRFKRDVVFFDAAEKIVYGKDSDAALPIAAASIFNKFKISAAIDERLLADGPIVTKTVVDSDGKPHDFDVAHPLLKPALEFSKALGFDAEQMNLTPKSKAEAGVNSELTKALAQQRAFFAKPGELPPGRIVDTEAVKK